MNAVEETDKTAREYQRQYQHQNPEVFVMAVCSRYAWNEERSGENIGYAGENASVETVSLVLGVAYEIRLWEHCRRCQEVRTLCATKIKPGVM
jgi:hypothetical protein